MSDGAYGSYGAIDADFGVYAGDLSDISTSYLSSFETGNYNVYSGDYNGSYAVLAVKKDHTSETVDGLGLFFGGLALVLAPEATIPVAVVAGIISGLGAIQVIHANQ